MCWTVGFQKHTIRVMPILDIHHPRRGRWQIKWDKGSIRVGRGSDNDLMVEDMRISGHHARFYTQGGLFWIEDLGSTNGTYLGARRISKTELRRAS